MNRYDIEREAIRRYGEQMQVVVCMEECAELIEALNDDLVFNGDRSAMDLIQRDAREIKRLCKRLRDQKDVCCISRIANDHVREETADVQIMLDQMKMIFGPTDVEEHAKLIRQAERMGMTEEANEPR